MDLIQTYNFANQHMKSARMFAKQAESIENTNQGQEFGPFFEEIRTLVSSTVIMSVCALEANINEHLMQGKALSKNFSDDQKTSILGKIEKLSILDKYQLGLLLNNKDEFNFATEPFESLQYLIKFRNMMVHYKSESDPDLEYSKRLENKLKSKIRESSFTKNSPGFLTVRAMSYSCAKWGVNTVLKFSQYYSEELGLRDKFESIELL